jgi:hypothetical protein
VALCDQYDTYTPHVFVNRVYGHVVTKNDESVLADASAGVWKNRESLADKRLEFVDEGCSPPGIVGCDEFENLKQIVARGVRELNVKSH